jgi:hypothetical protein
MHPCVESFELFVRGDLAPKGHPESALGESLRVDGQRLGQHFQEIRVTALALSREPLFDPPQYQPQRGQDDVLLGLIVMGHHARRVARRARDARHRRLLETVMCDHLARDVGDLVAALGVVDYLGHEGIGMAEG